MEFPLPARCSARLGRGSSSSAVALIRRSSGVFLVALAASFCLLAVARAQEKTPGRNVITQQDLVRMSKEQVGDALIIELVKAADELPNLTPQDVIELRKAGVSANVLTAVVQRRNTTATDEARNHRPAQAPADSRHRRARTAAALAMEPHPGAR